jgi:hypothetical protein
MNRTLAARLSPIKARQLLRSLFELKGKTGSGSIDLYFGPNPPSGHESEWIKTTPGKGWFTYFRIYGKPGQHTLAKIGGVPQFQGVLLVGADFGLGGFGGVVFRSSAAASPRTYTDSSTFSTMSIT